MMPHDPSRDPELKAFLRPMGTRPRMSAGLRRRTLENARAIADTEGGRPDRFATRTYARQPRVLRVAMAVSFVLIVGAVGAFAALRGTTVGNPPLPAPVGTQPAPTVPPTQDDSKDPVEPARLPTPEAATPARPALAEVKGDTLATEVEILRRARVAYGHHDFSATLALVGEHARRFPRGHLAEQREALRVRSLVGAGRKIEARRAAASFATRFPRSVLLSRVAEELDTAE